MALCQFISEFIKENPNCFNNDLTREHYTGVLKDALDKKIKEDNTLISDMPYIFEDLITSEATDTITGEERFVVVFSLSEFDFPGSGVRIMNDDVNFLLEYQVIAGITKEQYMELKELERYKLSGVISSRTDTEYNDLFDCNSFGFHATDRVCLGCFWVKDLQFTPIDK